MNKKQKNLFFKKNTIILFLLKFSYNFIIKSFLNNFSLKIYIKKYFFKKFIYKKKKICLIQGTFKCCNKKIYLSRFIIVNKLKFLTLQNFTLK